MGGDKPESMHPLPSSMGHAQRQRQDMRQTSSQRNKASITQGAVPQSLGEATSEGCQGEPEDRREPGP